MSQQYRDIPVTEKVYNSLEKLLERDETGVTGSAGTEFPQDLESWMIGRLCLRTDLKILYFLSQVEPSVVWTQMLDFSKPLATEEYVANNYQPLNDNLTALSNLPITTNSIPYFNSENSMSTLPINSFLEDLLNVDSASDTRDLLGLGDLATVDQITSSNASTYIDDASLPVSKFNFTPITTGEGYTTGDIKESYDQSEETGFITIGANCTIGSSASGAAYAGDQYATLYGKLWNSSIVSFYTSSGSPTSKGSNAYTDWSANKRMLISNGISYINPNCYYRIKI